MPFPNRGINAEGTGELDATRLDQGFYQGFSGPVIRECPLHGCQVATGTRNLSYVLAQGIGISIPRKHQSIESIIHRSGELGPFR